MSSIQFIELPIHCSTSFSHIIFPIPPWTQPSPPYLAVHRCLVVHSTSQIYQNYVDNGDTENWILKLLLNFQITYVALMIPN